MASRRPTSTPDGVAAPVQTVRRTRGAAEPGLRISKDLVLPLDAATETFAIIARRGRGKTSTAVVMVEEMIAADMPCVVIDPVGVWWGLRSGADGDSEGLPVVIFGGDHADVALSEKAGVIMADAIVEGRFPAIIDLSHLSKSAMRRFMADFVERIYHRNREPLHLVFDEADLFAPQRASAEGARLAGAMDDLQRRGRARGVGTTMITQRPAVLSKDILTQAEVLIALSLTGPRDVAAIDEWVRLNADDDQAREVKASLASLPVGTAWVWSPSFLELLKKVKIRPRRTYDSSATPKVGVDRVPVRRMASVDLHRLGEQIAAAEAQAADTDPRVLRKRVADLEEQLAAARATAGSTVRGARVGPGVAGAANAGQQQSGQQSGQEVREVISGEDRAWLQRLDEQVERISGWVSRGWAGLDPADQERLRGEVEEQVRAAAKSVVAQGAVDLTTEMGSLVRGRVEAMVDMTVRELVALAAGEVVQEVVDQVAAGTQSEVWADTVGVLEQRLRDTEVVGARARMKELRERAAGAQVDEPDGSHPLLPVAVTSDGRATAAPEPRSSRAPGSVNSGRVAETGGSSGADLPKAQRRILTVLAQHGELSTAHVALLSGYAQSGGFRNAMSRLRVEGLIVGSGSVQITDAGRSAIGEIEALPAGADLREWWKRHPKIGRCAGMILDVLAEDYPTAVGIGEIAERTGYAQSGGFRNAVSRLRSLGLAEGRGELVLSPHLT